MDILTIVQKITKTNPIIVSVIGAGISKASGMPTFRGEDGMWNQYHAQDLATPYAFAKNPKLVWGWYRARMRILLEAKPNPAHFALTRLEEEGLSKGIITQNVDGLHEIAGTKNRIEIHGRIRYARCSNCNHYEKWDSKEFAREDLPLPKCPFCENQLLRPDVVWFGESVNHLLLQKAIDWILESNTLLIIGTSGVVQPVASLPLFAKKNSAKIIEFNIEETPISPICDHSIFGPCEDTLPEFTNLLIQELKKVVN